MKPYLFIIRGLPGAGKSTLARYLWDLQDGAHPDFPAAHIETDQYFTKGGVYTFDAALLPQAHTWCQREVQDRMADEVNPVIVSNTFTRNWEMEPYKVLATKYDYEVVVIECGNILSMNELLDRQTHGVPRETLEKMDERWER